MPDPIDELLVSVRADTRGFAADIAQMRSAFDTTLVDGFAGAGALLERSLLGALRKGSLGFDDLKRTALTTLDQIAARALRVGLDSVLSQGSGLGGALTGLFGSLLGLSSGFPGRATGGTVAPDRPYLVGERGPEVFVPTSAGQVVASHQTGRAREVRVAIQLNAERGTSAPVAMQRSSRQLAAAVRRALL